MFIDDVYSNGKKSDGDYPLLSTAIKNGLFHPRCKDSTSTHYPELDDLRGPLSDDELAELDRQRGLEVQQQHAEKQAERFDRRAKYSLDEDNKKFAKARADEWHDRADKLTEKVKNAESNSSENVAKSKKGDILKEDSKKPITPITEKAINRVPKVNIEGYTEEQRLEIQKQHKELLKYSIKENNNNEVAFVFRKGLVDLEPFTGSDDIIDFGTSLLGKGDNLVILHNHPRNGSYSTNDLILFAEEKVKTLTIVKNNGNVEYLTKNDKFNVDKFKAEYNRLYKKMVLNEDDENEKNRFVKALLSKSKAGVIWSGKK